MTRVMSTAVCTAVGLVLAFTAQAQEAGNAACPGEEVFFDPGNGEDVFVPAGYRIEVFASGLNFPAGIAFRGNANSFEAFVVEAGAALPGRCNDPAGFPGEDGENPFLPQVRVINRSGETVDVLGRAPSVEARADEDVLHPPTIGIAFERGFRGGRLFVSDSLQQVRMEGISATNSSRIVIARGGVTPLITGLPTGDHPTEQITVKPPFIYWSQGSATNTGVVGMDNGAEPADVGVPPEAGGVQHDIPCQDVVLSGNNFSSTEEIATGGFLPFGVTGKRDEVVPAFSGATQEGMCTGAILRARLDDPQNTVEPFSWGYRNPFGLRFAPDDHPLRGALLVTENGEDERGARPVNLAPDRIHVTTGGVDFHGWPDRFGFLPSTQRVFVPIGGPQDDPAAPVGDFVKPLLLHPRQAPTSPIATAAADVAVVGLDFAPKNFAGGGNPEHIVAEGDALTAREGDFGFSPPNGDPILGHDAERIAFLEDGSIQTERFAFNCRAEDQVEEENGFRRCSEPANQAFVDRIRGINRPIDGKFGPDGAFYIVDFGAVRDVGQATPDSKFVLEEDGPLVQIPGTGVIWRISRE